MRGITQFQCIRGFRKFEALKLRLRLQVLLQRS
jgi:hypothetical protein